MLFLVAVIFIMWASNPSYDDFRHEIFIKENRSAAPLYQYKNYYIFSYFKDIDEYQKGYSEVTHSYIGIFGNAISLGADYEK
jgi:hypothetical protein